MNTDMLYCTKILSHWKPKMFESGWRHQMETFSALLAICAGNSPVPGEFPHKGQWRRALVFSLICARINSWVHNGEAGDLRRHRGHYDVIVMDVTWAAWRFKSAATPLVIPPSAQPHIKENITVPRYWSFIRWINGGGGFPSQRASSEENVMSWRYVFLSYVILKWLKCPVLTKMRMKYEK